MGLLNYKAHCSTVNDDTTYACATDEEMISFINNQEVHLSLENGNLVVYFKPFPVKYLNYLKKYNSKKYYRVLTMDEIRQSIRLRKIENNMNQVYIQLFRLSRRRSYAFNAPSYVPSFWHCKRNDEGHGDALQIAKYNSGVSTCSSYNAHGIKSEFHYLNFITRFKYCLSVQDAKRGYMVVLQNLSVASTSRNLFRHLILNYGTSTDSSGNLCQGSYDFHFGLVAGIVGPYGGIVYNPIEEDITYAKLK
jgi:hypothetical protein